MKYVAYDYETPGVDAGFWHIYALDRDPNNILQDATTIVTIKAPETEAMDAAVAAICRAIDEAVELAAISVE